MLMALGIAFESVGVEAASGTLWDWIAYGTRAGKGAGITELLNLPVEDLNAYLDAVSRNIERENEANKA